MRNGPRGVQRLRGVRFRTPARCGWPITSAKQIIGMGGGNGMAMVAVAAATISVITTTVPGDESLLCYDGLQPLHSRPIQALIRPLPRIPFWL